MTGLHYHPDPDQRAMVAAFDRPLDALLPIDRLHGREAEPWQALAELGLFGIAAPDAVGGVALGAAEEALLAIALGRRLATAGTLATMAAVHAGGEAATAEALVAGTLRVAPAFCGERGWVAVDAAAADLLLARDNAHAILVRPGALTAIDGGRWSAPLDRAAIDFATGVPLDAAASRRARLIDAGALAGMAACAAAMATHYAAIREQFGRPIGSFQAVKHHCADMAVAARVATDQVTFAASAIDAARTDAALQVESALLVAIDAALGNARVNIQVHGGIGFSDEADPHLVLRRAHLQVAIACGREAAAERVAAA